MLRTYIKFNRLLIQVLLNKIGPARTKVVKIFEMGILIITARCVLGWLSLRQSHILGNILLPVL